MNGIRTYSFSSIFVVPVKKYYLHIISFCFLFTSAFPQSGFRTIISSQPVLLGESFQVQFILENAKDINNFVPPSFSDFHYVTGPNIYSGSAIENGHVKQFQNWVYTLTGLRKGRFIIHGAEVSIKGKSIQSNDVFVEVLSKSDVAQSLETGRSESEYFLGPGEDPMKKINNNLFLKVFVDREACIVGEPIVATFKLYSRLQSRSDIVKNPGFYGFGVYDMVSVNERVQTTETVKGRPFDVHIIRKVQLYPFRDGTFWIDAMELQNEVEFSRSIVNKKTEQEVTERMMNNNASEKREGVEVFETTLRTTPVPIKVNPLPVKNRPVNFNGAVGNFSIKARVEKEKLKQDQQGSMILTIRGRGNFTQFDAPVIHWPQALEGFDPVVTDSFSRLEKPLSGNKTYRYSFVGSQPGNYEIPPVSFTYYDIAEKKYHTVSTPLLHITIEKGEVKSGEKKFKAKETNHHFTWWGLIPAGLVVCVLLVWLFEMKIINKNKKKYAKEISVPDADAENFIEEILSKPRAMSLTNDKNFYAELNRSIWKSLGMKFNISGSDMNKHLLVHKLNNAGVKKETISEVLFVLEKCEMAIYTDVSFENDAAALLKKSENLLRLLKEKV
jgi:BatD DUF11 like domain